jgi:hypothetical protein
VCLLSGLTNSRFCFNIISTQPAARRIVRYWNDRYKLFGQDKFCLPLTLKGALKDDSLALSRGYVQILPQTDTAGRALIYVDWSCHEPGVGYPAESMVSYVRPIR